MPTIKRKVEMNLPQLIEWGCKNEIEGERYLCNKNKNKGVSFNSVGNIEFDFIYTYSANDLFTVEVEEEITEDTEIPKLVVNHSVGGFTLYKNDYINNDFPLESVQAFYMLNDDLTLTLIWTREKGLVG